MMKGSVVSHSEMILPASVVTRRDVAHLTLEAEKIDSEMTASDARFRTSRKRRSQPVLSDNLEQFLEVNDIDIKSSKVRSDLIKQLRNLKSSVPVIHMTFSASADADSLQRIATWLRSEVHPQVVIDAGVQPSLVAGVYVRTANSVMDLSLRGRLKGQRELLVKELRAARG